MITSLFRSFSFSASAAASVLLTIGAFMTQAHAFIVTFDNLDTSQSGSATVLSPYEGFIWGQINNPALYALNDAHWTGAGNYNNAPGAPTAPNGVFNAGIVNVARTDGSAFDFQGAYFAPFTSNNDINSQGSTALSLFVEGYNGSNLIGTLSTSFSAAGYVWLTGTLSNVTSLSLYGTNPAIQPYQTRWLMDNFTWQPAVVPEPAAAALFAIGAAAAFAYSRFRKA